jgi:amidohydrolase
LKNIIQNKAKEYFTEIQSIRRHLHANPELSFKEFETSKFIQSILDKWEINYTSNWVETGIVAEIKGKNPTSKTIALRADIDALPILEENEVPYKSKHDGIMHACGHDVHSASLLGAIKILNDIKDDFEGTVRCIFQPGEEVLPGGASLMINEGVLKNPEPKSILGQHVFPDMQVGKVGFRAGMYMASSDEIYVEITGKGGHGALPHLNIDPVLIAAHIITSLQQIVSRNAKPGLPTVLSFGKVIANGATNIIPEKVLMEGTFRTMNEEWREKAHSLMQNMAKNIAQSMGGDCVFDIRKGYPFLVNDEALTLQMKNKAIEYLGAENVVDLDLRMTAEDFSYYSQQLPGCFYRLGTSNTAKNIGAGLHNSKFDIDEEALVIGSGLMAWLAFNQLDG